MTDRGLALIGIFLAAVFYFAPMVWSKVPAWISVWGLRLFLALIFVILGMMLADRRNNAAKRTTDAATFVDTAELVLRTTGNNASPTRVSDTNIWSWNK